MQDSLWHTLCGTDTEGGIAGLDMDTTALWAQLQFTHTMSHVSLAESVYARHLWDACTGCHEISGCLVQ